MTTLRRTGLMLLLGMLVIAFNAPHAEARPLYKMIFERVYEELAAKNKVDCGVCHSGAKKSELNRYGRALDEEIGEKNCRDEKKIEEAIRKLGIPRK